MRQGLCDYPHEISAPNQRLPQLEPLIQKKVYHTTPPWGYPMGRRRKQNPAGMYPAFEVIVTPVVTGFVKAKPRPSVRWIGRA